MPIDLTDAEVDALIQASFEPKIPARVMPKPGPAARHNFRAGVAYGLAAGRARAIAEAAQAVERKGGANSGRYAAAIRALNPPQPKE